MQQCCPCCLVICPTCCCGRTNHGVYEDEHEKRKKEPGSFRCYLCSPLVAIAELLTTIFLALSRMLFEESQDFKNTHRMTRHFSLEVCIIVLVVAATTRRDLIAMLYLGIAMCILCTRRRTVARFWMHFVQAPLFTISIGTFSIWVFRLTDFGRAIGRFSGTAHQKMLRWQA